jgi:Tol biopolymer transport system component
MILKRISRFVRLVCLLSIVSTALICLAVVVPRNSSSYGCLVAYSNDRNITYLLDTQTGQLRTQTLLTPEQVGPDTDYVSRFFKDETTAVYWAQRGGKEELLVALNTQTKQLSIVQTYNSATSLHRSADGKYLAAFEAGTSSRKNVVIYSLPDLQPVITRSWSTPFSFYAIEWAPAGHQFTYLEQNANNEVVLTLVNPETLEVSSAVIFPDAPNYKNPRLTWSPDREALAFYTTDRLDLYDVKTRTVRHIANGADFRSQPGMSPRVLWIGEGHRLLYINIIGDNEDFQTLSVYDPDSSEKTILAEYVANYATKYSPDRNYAVVYYPIGNGRWSMRLLDLQNGHIITIRENLGRPVDRVYWLDDRNEIALPFKDEIFWMRLDGTGRRNVKLTYSGWGVDFRVKNWVVYGQSISEREMQPGILNLDTQFYRPIGEPTDRAGKMFLAPDASVVGIQTVSGLNNRGVTLSLFAADGSWSRTFHTDTGNYSYPVWSPDSTEIAMQTDSTSTKHTIHILTADGRLLKQMDLPQKDLRFTMWNNCELP